MDFTIVRIVFHRETKKDERVEGRKKHHVLSNVIETNPIREKIGSSLDREYHYEKMLNFSN
jgi:hypothetical protein